MENKEEYEIPKIINYCWFGKGKKNKLFYKCLKSWKKYFPDYEIIEWNENNFDINSTNKYVKEAYEKEKYAFVSDYVRLKVMYENGGIYFDTDVEVLKKFDSKILKEGYFAKEKDKQINTGLGFSVPKNNILVKYMLEDYEDINFIIDGKMDLTACTVRNTDSLTKRGYKLGEDIDEIEGIKVYNKEYFCGFDVNTQHYIISDKTYTIHHYNASWLPKGKKIKKIMKRLLSNIIGMENYKKISNIKNKRR